MYVSCIYNTHVTHIQEQLCLCINKSNTNSTAVTTWMHWLKWASLFRYLLNGCHSSGIALESCLVPSHSDTIYNFLLLSWLSENVPLQVTRVINLTMIRLHICSPDITNTASLLSLEITHHQLTWHGQEVGPVPGPQVCEIKHLDMQSVFTNICGRMVSSKELTKFKHSRIKRMSQLEQVSLWNVFSSRYSKWFYCRI